MEKSGSCTADRSGFLLSNGGSVNTGIDRQPHQIGLQEKDVLEFFPPETSRNKKGDLLERT